MNKEIIKYFVLWHSLTQFPQKVGVFGRAETLKLFRINFNDLRINLHSYPINNSHYALINLNDVPSSLCGYRFHSVILLDKLSEEEIRAYIMSRLLFQGNERYKEIEEFENALDRLGAFNEEWKFPPPKPTFFDLSIYL